MKPSLARDADPEAYGLAMSKCQSYAPACSDAGECAYDGMCFSNSGTGFARARKLIEGLIEKEWGHSNVYTRTWLKLALDALDHNQFLERGALDVHTYLRINKEVRERCGWGETKKSRSR